VSHISQLLALMLLPLQKIDIIQVINFKYGWYNKFKKEQKYVCSS